MCQIKAISNLIKVLRTFKGHKELMLNISRILSKLSLDHKCSVELLKTQELPFLMDIMCEYKEQTPFVIRIAFVLGNLTTYYEPARFQLGEEVKGIKKAF